MLRFITTADTEILATAGAVERLPEGFPEVRCANPGAAIDHAAFVDDVLRGRARRALPRARRPARLARGLRPAARALRRAGHRAARTRRRGAARRRDDGALAGARGRGRAGRRVPAAWRHRQRRAVAALPGRHVPARGLRLRGAARGARPRRLRARARRRPARRGARAARSGAADRRRLLLPLAPPDRQHGLRRRALRARSRRRAAMPSPSGATRCGATPTGACPRSSCSPATSTR